MHSCVLQPTASDNHRIVCVSSIIDRSSFIQHHRGNLLHKGNTQLNYKDLMSEIIHTLSVTHSLSDETGPCAQSTLFDIAKPDELLEGGLDAYVLLRALERQIDRKVGVHKYEQLLDALAHLVV